VLDRVSLEVGPGELLALVGENGAGKSTLVKCIAGVVAPDGGAILLDDTPLAGGPTALRSQGTAVVWQDLALCDNLDTVANLFLGRERRWLLGDGEMQAETRRLLDRLAIDIDDIGRPVGMLSGGQRQSIAMARAMLDEPQLLILDEPTASLGVAETRSVERLIRQLRAEGKTVLLISHDLEHVFDLADRIVVLRQGRVVETLLPREVHPEDVVALMTGAEVGSTARKQLLRLESLVDQLSGTEPGASLPLIVSAMASALGQDMLCVHLVEEGADRPRCLRLVAAMGLPRPLIAANRDLPVGSAGGPPGLAAAGDRVVVVEDTRISSLFSDLQPPVATLGALSTWAAPIVGSGGVMGTVSGYGSTVGRLSDDQLRLVSLYASHAAAAIERERLLDEATRRNRVLETLRVMLETLAGAEQLRGGLPVALLSLCRGLDADAIALHSPCSDGPPVLELTVGPAGPPSDQLVADLTGVAARLLASGGEHGRARRSGAGALGAVLDGPEGHVVLTAGWEVAEKVGADAVGLFEGAARSLQLAIERESLMVAQQEADALRRSHAMQREFLSRLSHELRTPLTAIQGYVSTLQQPDVTWDGASQAGFLDRIGTESARLVRLVGDLLDSSAIEAGILRLNPDWCDLPLVIEAAIACLPAGVQAKVHVTSQDDVGPVWADHDRLEQVLVNLVDNAVRHNPPGTVVEVATKAGGGGCALILVADDGPGIAPDLAIRIFEPYERGLTGAPGAGLGLAIAKGIVDAHRGVLSHVPTPAGTRFEVAIPVDPPSAATVEREGGGGRP
jgi:signal transduction histidine kinase/ABC-type multidrug transport system ATPase subunit